MTALAISAVDQARPDAMLAAPPSRSARPARLAWVILSVLTVGGALARARGFTTGGVWRDDAWVALSAREGLGTALRMGVTAPGFSLLERGWIQLVPGSTAWAQALPYAMGVACIPVSYLLARTFALRRRFCLGIALLVATSPVCVEYSTRLKEYGTDFLLAGALLALTESARRHPGRRTTARLAVVSVVAFFFSASTFPVIAGAWVALAITRPSSPRQRRRVTAAAGLAGSGCLVVAVSFYRHVSPSLAKFWHGHYLNTHSPRAFAVSLVDSLAQVGNGINGLLAHDVEVFLMLVLLLPLMAIGLRRNAAMVAPGLALIAAIVASASGLIPLGTGRTDEVLYPAVLLLVFSGLQVLAATARNRGSKALTWSLRVGAVLGLLVVLGGSLQPFTPYPTTDTKALAAQVSEHLHPGDHVVVGELMRYPWALYEDSSLQLQFGTDWSTGFTVVSTQPGVFIAPSEGYEGGSDPARWARQLSGYRRLWFVEAPPLRLNPFYAQLLKSGWHRAGTLQATGCAAILLTRVPS